MSTINLGDEARDPISGFQGTVVAVTTWLHGCNRLTLQPKGTTRDGALKENATFDEAQLILVKSKIKKPVDRKKGGPRPSAVSKATPPRF